MEKASSDHGTQVTVKEAVAQRLIDPSWSAVLNLSPDFLFGLKELAAAQGKGIWAVTGQGWGRRWARRLNEKAARMGGDLASLDLDEILAAMGYEIMRGGWGELWFDLDSQVHQGIILVGFKGPLLPELTEALPLLLSGFIGGALSVISDITFDGHGITHCQNGVYQSQMAVAHRDRMALLRTALAQGQGWKDALESGGAA